MRTVPRLQPHLPSAGPRHATDTPQRGPLTTPRRGLQSPHAPGTAPAYREAATAPGDGEGMTPWRGGPQRSHAPLQLAKLLAENTCTSG